MTCTLGACIAIMTFIPVMTAVGNSEGVIMAMGLMTSSTLYYPNIAGDNAMPAISVSALAVCRITQTVVHEFRQKFFGSVAHGAVKK